MTFFFSKTIAGMHNERIGDRNNHARCKQPQENADVLFLAEKITSQ